jgi:hypothetical protein
MSACVLGVALLASCQTGTVSKKPEITEAVEHEPQAAHTDSNAPFEASSVASARPRPSHQIARYELEDAHLACASNGSHDITVTTNDTPEANAWGVSLDIVEEIQLDKPCSMPVSGDVPEALLSRFPDRAMTHVGSLSDQRTVYHADSETFVVPTQLVIYDDEGDEILQQFDIPLAYIYSARLLRDRWVAMRHVEFFAWIDLQNGETTVLDAWGSDSSTPIGVWRDYVVTIGRAAPEADERRQRVVVLKVGGDEPACIIDDTGPTPESHDPIWLEIVGNVLWVVDQGARDETNVVTAWDLESCVE